jgi:hypothetical protein
VKKTLLIFVYFISFIDSVVAQESLQGDEKLACEALLCLSTPTRPAQCTPSLRRYFSISFKRFSDTLRGRTNFLNLCPMNTDVNMASYISAVINGSARCDAASINQSSYVSDVEGSGYVNKTKPDYCKTYYSSQYTQSVLPVYVGVPALGGYWVDAKDFDAALSAYMGAQNSKNLTSLNQVK